VQFDSHLPTATVRESIAFSAELRLPPEVSAEEKTKRIDKVTETVKINRSVH
jgi:ABC-type multidrug transport system ATPase subunit